MNRHQRTHLIFRTLFTLAVMTAMAFPVACGGGGGGGGGGGSQDILPDKASVPSPADDSTEVSVSADLSWQAANNAETYTVYLGTSVSLGASDDKGNVSATSYDPGGLSSGTTYYWRVDANNDNGSTTGDVWSFATGVFSPSKVTGADPADDATEIAVSAILSWQTANGADSYTVYFGTASPLGVGDCQGSVTGTTWDPGTLSEATTYFWRVDSVNTDGTTAGDEWIFVTISQPPSKASGPTPSDGAEDVAIAGTMTWSSVSADSCRVYLGTSSSLGTSDCRGEVTATEYAYSGLSYDTTYYWRIDTINTFGENQGDVWSFVTGPEAPAQVSNPDPANGAVNVATDAELSWDNAARATSYMMYFGTTSALGASDCKGEVTGTYDPGTLSLATTYYWRVDSINVTGTTEGSTWRFTTVPNLPGLATGPDPADNATGISLDTDLSWTGPGDADNYTVFFGTSSTLTATDCLGVVSVETYNLDLLKPNTHYYWRIDTNNITGTTTGEVWDFTTVGISGAVAGYRCTYILLEDGTALAWGRNGNGALGIGSVSAQDTPAMVKNVSNFSEIKPLLSYLRGFGLADNSTLLAWGNNNNGELGVGDTSYRSTPQIALENVASYASGYFHTAAVLENGSVLVWGDNGHGQLGDNLFESERLSPGIVDGVENAVSVECGHYSVFVKTGNGEYYVWGDNDYSIFGTGNSTDFPVPALMPHFDNATLYVGYNHVVAQFDNGSVYTCGDNSFGQLGIGLGSSYSNVLVEVPVLQGAQEIVVGYNHNFAKLDNGSWVSWGYNSSGQLGQGDRSDRREPALLSGIPNIYTVSAGYSHSVIMLDNYDVIAAGDNERYQIGNGVRSYVEEPLNITGLESASYLRGGAWHMFAVSGSGTLKGWGSNVNGELGDATLADKYTPSNVLGVSGVADLRGNLYSTLALLGNGSIMTWGVNNNDVMGIGSTTPMAGEFYLVHNIETANKIWAGNYHAYARLDNGTIVGWGDNYYGQIGDNSTTSANRDVPVVVGPLEGENVTDIACGYVHTVFLLGNGAVMTAGFNSNGGLGDGTTTHRRYPDFVLGLGGDGEKAVAIAASQYSSFAVLENGSVLAWGSGSNGVLGTGSYSTVHIPTVNRAEDAVSIYYHDNTLVIKNSSGDFYGWGRNSYGQLGLGFDSNINNPMEMAWLYGADDVIMSNWTVFGQFSDGSVKASGNGSFGELADQTYAHQLSFVRMTVLED